ncbi:double zinc ribbon domain-containing protein [Clostridium perfringens]|uniref:double zinc ribbon domain-containing protein n=2 Tax=Clostridium perfringens TaxID=1502 RepID=UPI001FA96A27|nr:zinc ribbon domain-containing protein [Clostridium perfringens]
MKGSDTMKCPNCGHEEHIDDAIYCQECGTYLVNICENDNCEFSDKGDLYELPFSAKYCPNCGEKSSFNSLGFFDK